MLDVPTPLTPKEARAKWIEALRSGKYVQGAGRLNRNGRLCCLGVGCEVAVQHGVIPPGRLGKDVPGVVYYDDNPNSLPYRVQKFFGINTPDGVFDLDSESVDSLVMLNDHDRLSFEQIADVIKQEPPGLCESV